ncbi:MAG TPA: leucyl/phenylalanyl-tRNA--protein transferase [Drouetiella sp.]|jgi:leucyl/phenylalanyl-tRNA---protein transferase
MRDEFTPELVLRAYASGIFPMGDDAGPIRWYSPDPRCIFDLYDFHVPKRLARTYRQGIFDIKINTAWEAVMHKCAERESTWITDDIFRVYTQLHQMGAAHSVEAYYEGKLAGGLYGVGLGGAFMGESMFHDVTDASKVCLVFLVEHLRERGFILLDSQFMTSHLATFNAKLISKAEYMALLRAALTIRAKFD